MQGYTYSFNEVVAALVGPGGAAYLGAGSGASDEGITIDPSADRNTMTVGADGFGMHSLGMDRSGRISVSLLKTSPMNAVLQGLYNFQTASASNHGQNTLVITNTVSGDVITCEQVAFKKQPSIGYGKEAGMLVWEFDSTRITPALGANAL